MDGTRHEYLGGGITAVVSEAHSFGTDAVLLAHFASPGKWAVCCDLGSGCGIIPLLWCRHEGGRITAVELQPLGVKQIEAAIELNSLSDRLTAVNADLRDLKGRVPFGCFDLVTMNPPYKASGAGIESSSAPDKIARHETMCSLSEVRAAAERVKSLSHVVLRGLMTIPPVAEGEHGSVPYFEKVHALYVDINASLYDNKLDILSMGMSGDYEDAVRCGATMVRVGTAIFGARHYTL